MFLAADGRLGEAGGCDVATGRVGADGGGGFEQEGAGLGGGRT